MCPSVILCTYWKSQGVIDTKRGKRMFILDWIDENLDVMAPVGAFIGVGISLAVCFIFG